MQKIRFLFNIEINIDQGEMSQFRIFAAIAS